ncbi:MAG: hypothetical protein A2Y10_11555 [Planctomycetes bacterium GWF2_41_51]|nr:MAG: hypothetical protein A2Y10_11555 [Planctomycetes bacterium GWF2_41_51]
MVRKDSKVSKQSLEAAAKTGYYARTSRALYALLFLLPFIILYEILVLKINPQLLNEPASHVQGGVVAFVWIQNFLQYIGLNAKASWLFAPLVIIITLIVLQITSRQGWKIVWSDFLVMTVECIIISVPLIVLALVLNRPAQRQGGEVACLLAAGSKFGHHSYMMDIITGIGAGIYEELIFRLVLICVLMLFFETILGVKKTKAIMISIIISAVLFSLHHHFIFIHGRFARSELFALAPFIFRTIAGVYFAIIFVVRGFGIVAGAHIFYDIIATILNIFMFNQY